MNSFSRSCRNRSGFTLIELAVVLATVAILAAVGIPGVINWVPNYRLKKASTDMLSNFQRARLTAVKCNRNCAINFNQPVAGIVYDYIVFTDIDNNLEYVGDLTGDGADNDNDGTVDEPDEVETIIAQVLWENYEDVDFDTTQGGGDGLTFTTNDDGGNIRSVAFGSDGLPVDNAGGIGLGTVFLINTNGRALRLDLSTTGQLTLR